MSAVQHPVHITLHLILIALLWGKCHYFQQQIKKLKFRVVKSHEPRVLSCS